MPFLAFYSQQITDYFSQRYQDLSSILKEISDMEISYFSEQQVGELFQKCLISPPVLNLAQIAIEKGTVYVPTDKAELYTVDNQKYYRGETKLINNVLTFKIPFTGNSAFFYLRPFPEFPGVIGLDKVYHDYVSINFIIDPFLSPESQIQEYTPKVKKILTNIQSVMQKMAPEIENFNLKLKLHIQSEIARRKYFSEKGTQIQPPKPEINQAQTNYLGSVDLS